MEPKLFRRRGRSLSEGLMLEESEKGGLVVSSVTGDSSDNHGLREGDEIVGATIDFDQLSKNDVLNILKMMDDNGLDGKVHVLTKNNLSRSMGNLHSIKAPNEMLNDSYNRLYNAKIKRFMKDDSPGQLASSGKKDSNGQVKSKGPRFLKAKAKEKSDFQLAVHNMDSPVVKTPKADNPDLELSAPSVNLGWPKLATNIDDIDINTPDLNLKSVDTLPKDINVRGVELKGVDHNMLILDKDVGGRVDFSDPHQDLHAPDFSMNIPSGKIRVQSSKKLKKPNLDVDDPSGYFATQSDVSFPNLSSPDIDISSGRLNVKKPNAGLKAPDFDQDTPSGKLNMSTFGISGLDSNVKTQTLSQKIPGIKGGLDEPDLDFPEVNLKAPKLDVNTPGMDFKGLLGTIPKGPNLDLNLQDPGFQGPEIDLNAPNVDINAPSGKFKIPKFGLSGPKVKGPDLDFSAPKLKGGISPPDLDMPDVDLKAPKLNLNAPDFDINAPSGKLNTPQFGLSGTMPKGTNLDLNLPDVNLNGPKLDMNAPDVDISAPTGKFKMPKFGMSGPKVNGPDLDLSVPKFKGGISSPDLDLNGPKLDMNAPDVDVSAPSGKFKMPKFGFTGPKVKSPKLNVKAPKVKGINSPNMNLPDMDLKSPKVDVNSPNVDIKAPSGKFNMPTFGLSGPKLKTPDVDLKAPKIKGGINPPDLDMPDVDLKAPKLNMNAPDFDINAPSGKLNSPKFGLSGTMPKGTNLGLNLPDVDLNGPKLDMNAPDVDVNAPSGKFKMPKFGISGPKAKELDLDLSAPKFKAGFNPQDLNLKGQNPDVNAPNYDISAPSGKFKMPKIGFSGSKVKTPELNLKAPKIKGGVNSADISSPDLDLNGPKLDMNAPDVDISAPSGKFKMPKFGMSGPKVNGPDLNLSAPNFKGGINSPDLDMPDVDLKGPKLNFSAADRPSGRFTGSTADFEINTPNLEKPKMPSFGLSSQKRPDGDVYISPAKAKVELKALDLIRSPKHKVSSSNQCTPDISGGAHIKVPGIDMDTDVTPPQNDRKSRKVKERASNTIADFDLAKLNNPMSGMDTRGLDFNFDDPGGKRNIPKTSKLASQKKTPDLDIDSALSGIKVSAPKLPLSNYGSVPSQTDFNSSTTDLKGHDRKAPDGDTSRSKNTSAKQSDIGMSMPNWTHDNQKIPDDKEYFVTVFPKNLNSDVHDSTDSLEKPHKESNRRSHILRSFDLSTSNIDLDVPEDENLKGSTFLLSKFI